MTARTSIRAAALMAVLAVTAVMWSDQAIGWSTSIIDGIGATGSGASAVLAHRPEGDLDLHVALWGLVGALVAASAASWRSRWRVLAALMGWSVVVESLQPVVTDHRMFQLGDLAGNAVGIGSVTVVAGLLHVRRSERPTGR